MAASEGEDRGADEVAAGAGPERQQGRPSLYISFLELLSLVSRRHRRGGCCFTSLFAPSRRLALRRAGEESANLSRPTRACRVCNDRVLARLRHRDRERSSGSEG